MFRTSCPPSTVNMLRVQRSPSLTIACDFKTKNSHYIPTRCNTVRKRRRGVRGEPRRQGVPPLLVEGAQVRGGGADVRDVGAALLPHGQGGGRDLPLVERAHGHAAAGQAPAVEDAVDAGIMWELVGEYREGLEGRFIPVDELD